MSGKTMRCQSCARLCKEAKKKSVRLEKRVYLLTIFLTAALTLLGKKAMDEVLAIVKGIQDITESGEVEASQQQQGDSDEASSEFDLPISSITVRPPQEGTVGPQSSDLIVDDLGVGGITDFPRRTGSQALVDVVKGKPPLFGESMWMPIAPMELNGSSVFESIPVRPHLNLYPTDMNSWFATDSPFGGYSMGENDNFWFGSEAVPTPATITSLAIIPLLWIRHRR